METAYQRTREDLVYRLQRSSNHNGRRSKRIARRERASLFPTAKAGGTSREKTSSRSATSREDSRVCCRRYAEDRRRRRLDASFFKVTGGRGREGRPTAPEAKTWRTTKPRRETSGKAP